MLFRPFNFFSFESNYFFFGVVLVGEGSLCTRTLWFRCRRYIYSHSMGFFLLFFIRSRCRRRCCGGWVDWVLSRPIEAQNCISQNRMPLVCRQLSLMNVKCPIRATQIHKMYTLTHTHHTNRTMNQMMMRFFVLLARPYVRPHTRSLGDIFFSLSLSFC